MKTAQKIVNNLINGNIFTLNVNSLRQDRRYLGVTIYIKTHISDVKSFNIPFSLGIREIGM